MDPDQFRKIRIEINRLNQDIKINVEKGNEIPAIEQLAQASALLEELRAKAAGEIQARSVKNLGSKLKFASILIEKINISQKTSKRSVSSEKITWDEKRLSRLSGTFLRKLLDNMGSDTKSQVYFSAIGKGIKPSYQIDFGNDKIFAFSGSTHKKLKKRFSQNPDSSSPPFSFSKITTILAGKS